MHSELWPSWQLRLLALVSRANAQKLTDLHKDILDSRASGYFD